MVLPQAIEDLHQKLELTSADSPAIPSEKVDEVYLAPPRPYLRAQFIDCDLKDGKTYRAPVAIKGTDLWELIRLFVLQGAGAWLLPPSFWPQVAGFFGKLDVALHPARTRANVAVIQHVLGDAGKAQNARDMERGFFAGRYEERFQYLRSHRPGGWDPVIRIRGREHVEVARAAGQGMIFWGGSFAFNDLISKIAFHRLGLEVSHYTRPVHGLSNSRFGIRYLNSVRTSIESRYLGARVCAEDNVKAAMDVVRGYAEAGGGVSIKVGNRGRRRVTVPFLGGELELATGPVALAQRWGAVLLPTFTLRAPDGSFDVTIGEALSSSQSDPAAYAEEIVRQYAEQLAPILLKDPSQWRGWRLMKLRTGEDIRHSAKT
jgi:lauroyl/myristoyl acyltransferase